MATFHNNDQRIADVLEVFDQPGLYLLISYQVSCQQQIFLVRKIIALVQEPSLLQLHLFPTYSTISSYLFIILSMLF